MAAVRHKIEMQICVTQPGLNIETSADLTPSQEQLITFGQYFKGDTGEQGEQGEPGQRGPKGDKGDDGITPHIDSTTGNWFIGDVDTGVKAQGENGQDGVTPHIDQVSGNWFIGSIDTGVHAQGEKGDDGVGIPQELSISGNNLSISDGNTVELPIPMVNNATLTIQKNSTTVDIFTANASVDKTINIIVPTTAADVNALPSSTKYGASLLLSIDPSTYVVTAQLKDQDGNNLGTAQTIDLPLESVVVSGSYDSTNKKIVLTLQNGNTIDIPVGDLISGLQSEITAQNPLSADLLTDGNTNKVYTAAEKTKLAEIQAGAEVNVQPDWDQKNLLADDYIKNKPIFVVNFTYTNGNYVADISAKEFIDNIKANCFPVLYVAGNYVFYTTEYLFDSYSDGGEYLAEFDIINMNVQAYVTFMLEVIYHSDYDINTISFYRDASGTFSNVIISGSYNDLTDKPAAILYTQQTLTVEQQAQARANIGAGSSGFSGDYTDLTNKPVLNTNNSTAQTISANETINGTINLHKVSKTGNYNDLLNLPTLGTAAALDVAASGNASSTQVVKGDDTRLADSRPASDVSQWAKATTKPTYTASEVGAIPTTEKGANNGVAELDSNGKVPSSQLPSYVDDVLEYASQSAFPATGESGKIYIAQDTNKTYRWSGSAYVEISESLALGETSSTAYAGNKGKANADAIAAIKDGASIDSFGDVETALADKINKSSTVGLVKNDGTIDTNTYLTQHQDISGKANKSEMSVVDGTGSDADKTTITLKTGTSATVLKSHQDISGKQNVINSSNKLSADYIVDGTTNKVINVKPDWNAAAGNVAEILNKPTIPDAVSGTDDGTNWTSLTIGSITKNIPSGGGGGLTNYDFTHTANQAVSGSVTVTYAANTRGSRMVSASADLSVTFAVNNSSDNYLWIKNTGSSDIDILISSVTYNNSSVSNVYMPEDGISVPSGKVCEIGIVCNADGAFITSRSDLSL